MACLYGLFCLPIQPLTLVHRCWNKYKTKDGLLAVMVAEVSCSRPGRSLTAKLF